MDSLTSAVSDVSPPRATCPRCGYDLSGVADASVSLMPESVVCSECGLDIEWDDLRRDVLKRAAWNKEHHERRDRYSFEHGSDRRATRFARTAVKCMLPESVYSWIGPREQVRFDRLGVFIGAATLLWLLLVVVPAVATDLWNVGSVLSGVGGKTNQTMLTFTELVVLQGGAMTAGAVSCLAWARFGFYPRARAINKWNAKQHTWRILAYAYAGTLIIHTAYSLLQWVVIILCAALGLGLLSIPVLLFTLFFGWMYAMLWCAMWPGATMICYFNDKLSAVDGLLTFLGTAILSVVFAGILVSI